MSTLDWSLQQATKTTAQIAAATTTIPLTGQIVWNTSTGKYCIGDGVTALSALTFYGGISASGLTVGTTTITGGTTTRVLYNNAGVVGEYAVSGTGSVLMTSTIGSTVQGYSASTTLLGNSTTGSGSNIVLGTSPTFVTDITTPSMVLSGAISAASWTTNGVKIKTTASVLTNTTSSGTVANTYTNVFGGNSIVSSSATTYTSYYANYFKAEVQSTGSTITNNWAAGFDNNIRLNINGGGIYFGTATSPVGFIYGDNTTNLIISAPATNSLRVGNIDKHVMTANQHTFQATSVNGTPTLAYEFKMTNTTVNTTSGAENTQFKITGNTFGWAAGTLALQRFTHLTGNTIAFASGSNTVTTAYTAYFDSSVAGTNCAGITNNYSLGTAGKAKFGGNVELTQTVTTEALVSDTSVTIVINGVTYKLLAKA